MKVFIHIEGNNYSLKDDQGNFVQIGSEMLLVNFGKYENAILRSTKEDIEKVAERLGLEL